MTASPSAPADLVLVGGDVATMDAARSHARGVAVAGGRIVAVGSDPEIRRRVGPRTRVIELAGRTLLPGFHDAHVHPAMAGPNLLRCPLHEVERTLDTYLELIDRYARANPADPWVQGDGWYMEAFPGGTPSRHDLDRVTGGRPAFFVNRDGHGAWVNTRALELAGIGPETPDPADGRIEREPDGSPQGTLHEGAMEIVRRILPPTTLEDRVAGLGKAQAYLHRLGVVGWQDAWVTAEDLEGYLVFTERGHLTGRAVTCHWWDRERGGEQIDELVERRRAVATRVPGSRLAGNTIKVMQDGVAENYTAAMLDSYLDGHGHPTGNRGISFVDPEALKAHVTRLDALGFQVHFHALGDRAVREALDAVEAARAANGFSDTRPHLAHLQVVDPAEIRRFRPLGAIANIQTYWACNDGQMIDLTEPYLAPGRYRLQYPFRALLRAGVTVAAGSDWTVSTPNVMAQAEVAVTRVSPELRDRDPLLPDEAITLTDVLGAFTAGSAFVSHLEGTSGTVEVGKAADLVVLDRDVFAEAPGRIGDTRVLLTLVEGAAVHEDPALEGGAR
jgi:predicted amidohydrolase YtcJ